MGCDVTHTVPLPSPLCSNGTKWIAGGLMIEKPSIVLLKIAYHLLIEDTLRSLSHPLPRFFIFTLALRLP